MNEEAPRFTKTEFRQVKYLLYFVVFIILFQVFQYVTTKRATHKYRELFTQATEIVALTNSISFETANIHRSVLNLSFTSDTDEVRRFTKSLEVSEDKIGKAIAVIDDKIVQYELYTFEKTLSFVSLKLANSQYKSRYQQYMQILEKVSGEQQLYYRRKVLRPALERFQERQNEFLFNVFSDQQKAAEDIAAEADRTGFNLLIGGNILLMAVAFILAYIILSERKKVV